MSICPEKRFLALLFLDVIICNGHKASENNLMVLYLRGILKSAVRTEGVKIVINS